jgi:hypothetical protein
MSSILKVDQLQDSGGNAIITSNGSGTFTSSLPNTGITMADQWRLTASTNQGTDGDVTTNWERVDTDGYGSLGTGLTESSGIFSFPQTGYYHINFTARLTVDNGDSTASVLIQTTTDNSTYNQAVVMSAGNLGTADIAATSTGNFIFDVTNTSTHKFKLTTSTFSAGTGLNGNSNDNRSHLTVIRLGDT